MEICDPRTAVTYLVRIEVRIEYDDRVRGPEIDTDTSSSSTQDVYERIRVRLVELIHVPLTVSLLCVTILHVRLDKYASREHWCVRDGRT